MIPILTAAQMREADRVTIDEIGIPGRVLMEIAGRACAQQVMAHAPVGALVGVVCGTGNNGGDGLVVARVLLERGYGVVVIVGGARDALKADAAANLQSFENCGGRAEFITEEHPLRVKVVGLRRCAIVVDALFGTGLSRELEGLGRAAVEALNADAMPPILSVDVPSGVDSDTGRTLGASVKATWTVALGALKRAHALVPGADRCGEVIVADIGIPSRLMEGGEGVLSGLNLDDARRIYRPREIGAHKGSSGHVAVLAGTPGMLGAAVMAAHGALRTGAGRVSLFSTEQAHPARLPSEVTTAGVKAGELQSVVEKMRIDALTAGTGLAPDDDGARRLDDVVALDLPAALDAGAMTLLAGNLERLKPRTAPTVLTPHPAELARLLGISTSDVQADRVGTALRAAELSGAVVINKGARSVIASPTGEAAVCMLGHPVLAAGGTGDVLAGIVGALLARGCTAWEAACLGTLIHARAGEICAKTLGPEGVLATEIADALPRVFLELEG